MIVAFAIAAIVASIVLIWRAHDVRVVLFVAALAIGAVSGHLGEVFRKIAESLADAKFLLPICSAMGFAYVVRETGCVDALVRLLIRPIERVPRLILPVGAAIALVVNMAIPSQTSTLAAVGPLVVALLSRLGTARLAAGAALVLGASVAGALLNPGLAEIAAVASLVDVPAARVVVPLAPGVLAAFAVGLAALLGWSWWRAKKDGVERDELLPLAAAQPRTLTPTLSQGERGGGGEGAEGAPPAAWRAILPPLPVLVLLLGHPSLPWHRVMARALPPGLEVFTVMLAGTTLVLALAARDRRRAARAVFDGMGYAFANVITVIAVSAGTAKALDGAGALSSFVELASGSPTAVLVAAFALAFGLAVVSGSGTAASVALVGALGPRAAELGLAPLALAGVILFGAEAGRTTSPVAAVLLFGSSLVDVQPRQLAVRLFVPCLLAAAAGALVHVLLS